MPDLKVIVRRLGPPKRTGSYFRWYFHAIDMDGEPRSYGLNYYFDTRRFTTFRLSNDDWFTKDIGALLVKNWDGKVLSGPVTPRLVDRLRPVEMADLTARSIILKGR